MIIDDLLSADLRKIGSASPLVHNITNFVVMNNTANALLCLGASPVMAHARDEVEDMTAIAAALVINVGTLSAEWVESMSLAMKAAERRGIPIVYDPVGAGATPFRNSVNLRLLGEVSPTIIRGNGSEIMALEAAFANSTGVATKGVDSTRGSEAALEAALAISARLGSTVVISGKTDYIVSNDEISTNDHGVSLMARVTGMGCTATALCGAFVAINPSPHIAARHAMMTMGIAAEQAYRTSQAPGSFQVSFLDALYVMSHQS